MLAYSSNHWPGKPHTTLNTEKNGIFLGIYFHAFFSATFHPFTNIYQFVCVLYSNHDFAP